MQERAVLPTLTVTPADTPADGDDVFGCPGALLAVSPATGRVLAGAHMDYGAQLRPPRFQVLTYNARCELCFLPAGDAPSPDSNLSALARDADSYLTLRW